MVCGTEGFHKHTSCSPLPPMLNQYHCQPLSTIVNSSSITSNSWPWGVWTVDHSEGAHGARPAQDVKRADRSSGPSPW